jgi:cyclase
MIRLIPVLLLKGKGLVKTSKFKNPVYIGDPINAVRIFNEKEVDELVLCDIAKASCPLGMVEEFEIWNKFGKFSTLAWKRLS